MNVPISNRMTNNIVSKIQLKIADGTRSDDAPHLCESCINSTIIKGAAHSQESTYCQRIGEFLRYRIVSCNCFYSKTATSLRDMYDMAWILSTDEKKKYGFVDPGTWKQRQKESNRFNEHGFDSDPLMQKAL